MNEETYIYSLSVCVRNLYKCKGNPLKEASECIVGLVQPAYVVYLDHFSGRSNTLQVDPRWPILEPGLVIRLYGVCLREDPCGSTSMLSSCKA